MRRYIINTFVFLLSTISFAFATAGGYGGQPNQFDYDSYTYNHNGSGGKGDIKHSRILYNNSTQDFQLNYNLDRSAGVDFLWAVVSTGDVKGSQNHAIMYTDLKSKKVSVYRYDTGLGVNSYKAGDLLGTFKEDGNNMVRDNHFTINVGGVNSAFGGDWEGVEINDKGGIWFHSARDSRIQYDAHGRIVDLEIWNESWVDRANFDTKYVEGEIPPGETPPGGTPVSAPFGMLAIMAAFGLLRLKRRK